MNQVSIRSVNDATPICFMTFPTRLSACLHTGKISSSTSPMNVRPMNLSMIQFIVISPVRSAVVRPRMYIMKSSEDTKD